MTPYCGGGADDPLPRPNPPLYRKKIQYKQLNTVQENLRFHTVQEVAKVQEVLMIQNAKFYHLFNFSFHSLKITTIPMKNI